MTACSKIFTHHDFSSHPIYERLVVQIQVIVMLLTYELAPAVTAVMLLLIEQPAY